MKSPYTAVPFQKPTHESHSIVKIVRGERNFQIGAYRSNPYARLWFQDPGEMAARGEGGFGSAGLTICP